MPRLHQGGGRQHGRPRFHANSRSGRASTTAALAQAIVDCGAAAPGPHDLVFARQLFARTIETPGGLKIQTLHAFAERLLRLFPFEANVPAHFNVLDESELKRLLIEARDAALAELSASSESKSALELVARESGAGQI